jgi:general secretion pathway protein J
MSTARSRRWRMRGFTLLEALLAMALMGMIVAALAAVTGNWLPNWSRGLGHVQQSERIALALERLVADLAAAEFISAGREVRQPWFDGENHGVTFVRSVLAPDAPPGLELVRIGEISSEHGPILVRTQAPFVPVSSGVNDRDQVRFSDPVVLQRPPYRVLFSYAGFDRIWTDTWRGQILLPRAIRFTLRDMTTQQILAISTATLVHAELPAECITTKSLANCIESRLRTSGAGEVSKPRS